MEYSENNKFPPILAKTWLEIISQTDDDELRGTMVDRVTTQFGSVMKASQYVEEYFGKKSK